MPDAPPPVEPPVQELTWEAILHEQLDAEIVLDPSPPPTESVLQETLLWETVVE